MSGIRRWAALFLVVLFSGGAASACSCSNTVDNFLDAVRLVMNSSYVDTQMAVVKCRYLGNVGNYGARFGILHRYYTGRFMMQDTVVIWGDPGWCCRFSARGFYRPGDTLLAIIHSLRFQNVATAAEAPGDFYIYSCNYNHAWVHNDSVFGGSAGSYTFGGCPLQPFADSLSGIISALNLPPVVVADPALRIYPNPAEHLLYIELDDDPLAERAVSITSYSGTQVYTGLLYRGLKGSIDVGSFAPGLYFVGIARSGGRMRYYKVLIR